MSRVFQWIIIILVLSALGGGYWYWKNARAGVAQQSVPIGLVGYWNFDEGTSTTAGDTSNNHFNGTLMNGPTWVAGRAIKGLDFDGADDYVSIPDQDVFSPAVNDLTISFWAKIPTNAPAVGGDGCGNAGRNVLGKGNGVSGWEYTVENDNNATLCFNLYQGGGSGYASVSVGRTLNDGQWHHYSMSIDYGVLLTVYIDGVSVGSTSTFAGSMLNTALPLEIGRRGDGGYFTGQIDEVRAYNKALIAAEVADIYALGAAKEKTSDNTGLVGYWSFEDGRGTQATDFSPAGNNTGTLTNGPTWTDGKMGKALSFDGVNDYVDMGNPTNLQFTGNITLSAWINPTSLSDYKFYLSKYSIADLGYDLGIMENGRVVIAFRDGTHTNGFSSVGLIQAGVWQHVVIVQNVSNCNVNIYKNGTLDSTLTNQPCYSNASSNFLVGSRSGIYFFGSIDEVRVYNRALLATEIADLYSESSHATINDSRNSILTNGLVGQWSFNGPDVSGTTAYDRSGQGNNGTLTNGPSVIPGKIGQALSFNGLSPIGSIVTLGDPLSLRLTGGMTLSAWVNPTRLAGTGAETQQAIISKSQVGTGRAYMFTTKSDGTFTFSVASDVNTLVTRSTNSLVWNINNWYFVTGVYNASAQTMDVYVNGVLNNGTLTGTVPASQFSNNGVVVDIGGRSVYPDSNFKGSIDEVRIYNRALSATEINDLYLMGR